MNFSMIGGDARSVRLAGLLREDGHTVRHFALEQALPDGAANLAAALEKADCVVLPLPAARDGALNAPYSASVVPMDALLHALPSGTLVCAGKADPAMREICTARGLILRDYFLREDFTLANAVLTANAAAALMAGQSPLSGKHVLISGYGRIGKHLASLLLCAGAAVTVAARNPAARAQARSLGCRAVPIAQAPEAGYDFVVNTVPSPIFGLDAIRAFGSARCIELASPPYGFDLTAARDAGTEVLLASGLPGKYAPDAAAAAVRDSIYAILEE